jgi:excisionase family DNA binding protein
MKTQFPFVSIDVAASCLGVPKPWFRKKIRDGEIPVILAGRRKLVALEIARDAILRIAQTEGENDE